MFVCLRVLVCVCVLLLVCLVFVRVPVDLIAFYDILSVCVCSVFVWEVVCWFVWLVVCVFVVVLVFFRMFMCFIWSPFRTCECVRGHLCVLV